MKGAHKRFQKRQEERPLTQPCLYMSRHSTNLFRQLVMERHIVDDPRTLVPRLKPNEVYAVRAKDDSRYFRTIMIKRNQMNNAFQTLISNPVMGEIPEGIQEVSQEQVFKQMREMNASMISGQDLQAFPFTGVTAPSQSATGHGLVSQQHKNLQGRNRG